MKLMFYINSIKHGGAERVLTTLASQFSTDYKCIFVTSFKAEGEYSLNEKVKRISCFEKPIKGAIKRNYLLIKKLRKLVKQEKPDVLISFMAEPNFRALIATKGLKTKNIISIRNDPNKEYGNFLFRFLAKRLYRKADGVVFQTEDAKNWFSQKIQRKSKIIYNQVDERFFSENFQGERKDIVSVGRLTAQKNQKILIEAFALIADKIEDNLIIYGEGNLRNELEELIKQKGMQNRVFLPGMIQNVQEAIKGVKMFVLPSDYEGMPNALMEAMALGLPCVSTDCPCGGPRMLIQNGNNGVLVPINDVASLSEAIYKIVSMKKEEREKFGEKAKETAKNFAPNVVFEQWESFVKTVIDKDK